MNLKEETRDRTKRRKDEVIIGKGGVTEAGWHEAEPLLRCPKAYQFGVVRGIHTPVVQMPSHFAKGLDFAAGRAVWFASGFDTSQKTWLKIQDAVRLEGEKARVPIAARHEAEALIILQEYINHWSKRPQPRVRAVEYKLGPVPLSKDDPPDLTRTCRLDDVSSYPESGNTLAIGEAKTCSDDIASVVRQYELHGQPYTYRTLWYRSARGARRLGPISGMVLDVIKKPPKMQFARVFVELTDYAATWFPRAMRHYLEERRAINWDSDVDRNITACTYMAGRARVDCEFKDLCRFGKSASAKYVLRGGDSLRAYQPKKGAERMPWE